MHLIWCGPADVRGAVPDWGHHSVKSIRRENNECRRLGEMDRKRVKPSGAQFRKKRREEEEKRAKDKGMLSTTSRRRV